MIELDARCFEIVVAHSMVLVSWYRSGWAPWRAFAPIYQAASRRHPDVVFARVDAEREHALAACCRIEAIPTLMAFQRGALVVVRAGFDVADSLDALVHRLRRRDARQFSESPGKTPGSRGRRVRER